MRSINILPIKIQKLVLQGKIDKAYSRMYALAEELATYELNKNLELINYRLSKSKKIKSQDYGWEYVDRINKYKEKRINFHMNKMKELLQMSLNYQDKK